MSADRLHVDGFVLYGDEASLHFDRDHDLDFKLREVGIDDHAQAYVLITVGVDGEPCHVVRTDDRAGVSTLEALHTALETLQGVYDQMACMHSAAELRALEKNAFDLGVDAERAGLVPRQGEPSRG